MQTKYVLFFLSVAAMLSSQLWAKTVGDALEVSRKNLAGHRALYDEGWLIVTSTKEAIETAERDSQTASKAMSQALQELSERRKDFSLEISKLRQKIAEDEKKFRRAGQKRNETISAAGSDLANEAQSFSKKNYADAYAAFTLGYLELKPRTQKDWDDLKKNNADFFDRSKNTFNRGEIKLIMDSLLAESEKKSDEDLWSKSLARARTDFDQSYEKSGTRGNSLAGLAEILRGYTKALYDGILKPGQKSVVRGVQVGGTYLIAGAIGGVQVASDVVYTTGLNLYSSTKMGYALISPTLEGGFLASLALISATAQPALRIGGSTLKTLNQVAVTSASPVLSGGQFLLASTVETARASLLMTYDLTSGAAQALIQGGHGAFALGSNALTALPAQTLLAVANAAVFLVYDGPHLALVALRGDIDGVPVTQVRTGTVLDAKALEQKGVRSEILNVAPETWQKVLETSPRDLRP